MVFKFSISTDNDVSIGRSKPDNVRTVQKMWWLEKDLCLHALLCASVRDGDKGAISVVGLLDGAVVPFVRDLFVPFRPLLRINNILDSNSNNVLGLPNFICVFLYINISRVGQNTTNPFLSVVRHTAQISAASLK